MDRLYLFREHPVSDAMIPKIEEENGMNGGRFFKGRSQTA